MRRRPPRLSPARSIRPSVELMERRALLATFVVTNTMDDVNPGSLRYAITQSNATNGPNRITFAIASSGVQTITPASTLPAITMPVTIDGTTEPGYSGTPLIELNGSEAGEFGDGLDINAGGSTVEGLAINRFGTDGIKLSTIGGDVIVRDFLGTDPTGTIAEGNVVGLLVQAESNNNTISGNLTSGNQSYGIFLDGTSAFVSDQATLGNLVIGNAIGIDVTGGEILGNGTGIGVRNAPMTTIGGTTAAARNIITSNGVGIILDQDSDGTLVEGNYIGTDITGELAIGHSSPVGFGDGIDFDGISNSTIGGTAAGAGNVMSGLKGRAIGCFGNVPGGLAIQGNLVGTDATGMKPLGNQAGGLSISGPIAVTIGGSVAGARNVISGNLGDGIDASSSGMVIQGNDIGTAIDGVTPLGNDQEGIHDDGGNTLIGGLAAGEANIIAYNGFHSFYGGVRSYTGNISILSNSIHDNNLYGIFLNATDNTKQASPVLTSAISTGGGSVVKGSLASANGTYTLQFFATPKLDSGGKAEGQTLLGTQTFTVTNGSTGFSFALPGSFAGGTYVSATATDSPGNTSAFSVGIVGTGPPPTLTASASASTVPAGQSVTDTFSITNPDIVNDTGVAFSDPIPAGVTFVSGITSTGVAVTLANGVATANIGNLTAGQSVTVAIALMTSEAAMPSFTNTGQLTAKSPAIAAGADTASVTTAVVPSADLRATVGVPPTSTATGRFAFTATIANLGPDPALGTSLVDKFTLPAGASIVADVAGQGTVQVSGNVVTVNLGTMLSGASVGLTVVILTNAGGVFGQSAFAGSSTADPHLANNMASTSSTILGQTGVALSASAAYLILGRPVTLTAQVSVPPGFPTATRTVTFYDGQTALGTAMLDAYGSASLVVPSLARGTRHLTASYSGDGNVASATSPTSILHVGTPPVGDYDGDGKADIAVYDRTTATFFILESGGGAIVQHFGNPAHVNIPVIADFDGDGKTDLAIYDQTASTFFVLESSGGTIVQPFGNPRDVNIPVAGDYDGDGKADLAIYDQTAATFYVLKSSGGGLVQPFGSTTQVNIPVAGDYDGDGRTDLGIYDETAATFFVLESGGGSIVQPFGSATHANVPLAGDYDGDGKADLAIYDATTAIFYVLDSGGGSVVQHFGNPADLNIPIALDLDGDGKADLVIYDATTIIYFIQDSGGGGLTQPFGPGGHVNRPA